MGRWSLGHLYFGTISKNLQRYEIQVSQSHSNRIPALIFFGRFGIEDKVIVDFRETPLLNQITCGEQNVNNEERQLVRNS